MLLNLDKKTRITALILVLLGAGIILVQYFPVLKAEFNYYTKKTSSESNQEVVLEAEKKEPSKYIIPSDKEFGLVIPKIGINVSVIPEVDPNDSNIYQQALSQGVAHVKKTVKPDKKGNTVIFAHSSDNFYNANCYNAVFYLLNKLEENDPIYLTYNNKLYKYAFVEKMIVNPEEVQYMAPSDSSKLTLITCWPPGTTIKRMVAIAEIVEK